MRRVKYMGLILLGASSLSASHIIDSKSVLNFSISDKGLTRISIENESIKDMFAFPSSENIKLHPSGHLFVAPSDMKEPLYLTVITADGTTQDLKLTFTEKTPKPVVLKMQEAEKSVSKAQIERWLDGSLAGAVPLSFEIDSGKFEPRYTESAVAKQVTCYSNAHYTLSIWSVENRKNSDVTLQAKDFSDPEEAGKLQDNKLAAFGKTKLVVIAKKKGLKA